LYKYSFKEVKKIYGEFKAPRIMRRPKKDKVIEVVPDESLKNSKDEIVQSSDKKVIKLSKSQHEFQLQNSNQKESKESLNYEDLKRLRRSGELEVRAGLRQNSSPKNKKKNVR
jgi:hypothetical protein